jgi:phosphoacetylglucosamine mutase
MESIAMKLKSNVLSANLSKVFAYGTAGFRDKHEVLDGVCFRAGVCAALLSLDRTLSGIMITASHNHMCDNGLKLVDANGTILPKTWELRCGNLVNSQNFASDIEEFILDNGLNIDLVSERRVIVGYDTRDSSP